MTVDLRTVLAVGILSVVGIYALAFLYASLIFTELGEKLIVALPVLAGAVAVVWAVSWLL